MQPLVVAKHKHQWAMVGHKDYRNHGTEVKKAKKEEWRKNQII